MSFRFAGDVSSVELGEGGVDVVDVEYDARRDAFIRVKLENLEDVFLNRIWVGARAAPKRENVALAPGSNDVPLDTCQQSDFGGHPQVFDCGISTAVDPGVHDSAAILEVIVLSKVLCHRIPVAGGEVLQEAFRHSVFQSPRMKFVEPRKGGIQIFLTEDFQAVE